MGTEKLHTNGTHSTWLFHSVKLNNPLMGTENLTAVLMAIISLSLQIVKLNNPLMGTENPIYSAWILISSMPIGLN